MANRRNKQRFQGREHQIERKEEESQNHMKTYFCPACTAAFMSDEEYRKHYKEKHSPR